MPFEMGQFLISTYDKEIMKKLFVFVFFVVSVTNAFCQNADSVVVSGVNGTIIYPLISDKTIEKQEKQGRVLFYSYPLLIVNGIIIREEEKVNCFRNNFEFVGIKKTKRISNIL